MLSAAIKWAYSFQNIITEIPDANTNAKNKNKLKTANLKLGLFHLFSPIQNIDDNISIKKWTGRKNPQNSK